MQKGIIAVIVIAIIIILIVVVTKNKAMDTGVEVVPETVQTEEPNLPDVAPVDTSDSETSPKDTEPSVSTTSSTQTVLYTATGFSPETLIVNKGDKVTFTNNTSGSMWVASDPHPQHTDFSAFDAGKGYAGGTSYTYTFMEAGTYTYHDHLHSSMRGTVVVK